MDMLDDLRWAMQLFGLGVGAVEPEMWSRPTPCARWSVAHLVTHVIGGEWETACLLGEAGLTVPVPAPALQDLADLAVTWEVTARAVQSSWPGAGHLSGLLDHPAYGGITGERLAELRLLENVLHLWDLSEACDFGDAPPPELVERALAVALTLDGTGFVAAPAASDETDPLGRLLAVSGRRRDWWHRPTVPAAVPESGSQETPGAGLVDLAEGTPYLPLPLHLV